MKKLFISMVVLVILSAWMNIALAMDVTLTCDPNTETDLAGYKIYWSTTSGGPYAISKTFPYEPNVAPTFPVTGIANVKTFFVATAYDTEGLESGYSNEVNTGPIPIAPSVPTNLRITTTK